MRRIAIVSTAVLGFAGALVAAASGQTGEEAAPIYGISIASAYRNWTLISMANVGSPVNDIRAKLGNDLAIRAYREGKTSFPDGAIIASSPTSRSRQRTTTRSFALLLSSAASRPSR